MREAEALLVRRLTLAALRDPQAVLSLAPADLDLTLRLMRRGGLLGHLAARLKRYVPLESLPSPLGDHLLSALISAEARSRVGLWELDRILAALGPATSFPLVALKGCAYLLANTPNAAGRNFNDVDLLVPKSALDEVEGRLKANGWTAEEVSAYDDHYYRTWAHELPPLRHRERQVEVDLHHNLLMASARLSPSAELLLAGARPAPGSRFHVLAPIDMTLHAMTHLFMGEMDEGLRQLVDVDQLLRHFGDNEPGYWQNFWRRAEELDLARPAFYGLRYSMRYLETPVPEAVASASQASKPPNRVLSLMDRLVAGELFPPHPDGGAAVRLVPTLLLARAHWLRMPPFMLARHLSYKFLRKHWRGTARA